MSWAKRNIYFLASCIVAVVLLGAAGWYCYTSMTANNANWGQLEGAYKQLGELATKPLGPGNDQVDNIKAAKEQAEQVKQRVEQMAKFFTPVRGIPDTNKFGERTIPFAVRDTVSQLRRAAQEKGVIVPTMTPEFAFAFSLQMSKTTSDPAAAEALSHQLGEVKTLCDVLFNARILQLDSIQRERTPDDVNLQMATGLQPDYADSISLTSGNIVITPYQVSFQCFTPQLGAVLASFANQPHTIVVKTLNIQPADQSPGGGGYIGGGGYPAAGGGYPGGYGNPLAGGAAGAYENPAMQPGAARAGSLQTIIDEKKLRVNILVDFVKITPAQGR